MSKSKNNGVDSAGLVGTIGDDTRALVNMFAAPPEQNPDVVG